MLLGLGGLKPFQHNPGLRVQLAELYFIPGIEITFQSGKNSPALTGLFTFCVFQACFALGAFKNICEVYE